MLYVRVASLLSHDQNRLGFVSLYHMLDVINSSIYKLGYCMIFQIIIPFFVSIRLVIVACKDF